ncbi:restriction endonuclease subunit S [Exiguobacterium sp. TDN 0502]|uniref:restriction endonuclease subunit S n=1 Tax=Exiguobacterium sp. TDN 0502 TaxID=3420731 RepID=UPI003D78A189
MAKLKPYEKYKETNVNWMGSMPSHWEIRKNSLLFREVTDTNHTDLELLSIMLDRGIVKQSSTGRKKRMSENNQLYKRICVGDIGYNLMNAFMGSIGASKYEGIISPAYAVCRPKIKLNPWYYHYLFRTPMYKAEFNKNSYGIMYERNRLYFDRFKRIFAFVPPVSEQDQIVRYLDYQLTKINKFIKVKRKLISLLKEQKQAVVNEAVTKGINRDVKVKQSGIDLLGEIPDCWDVKPLKYYVKSNIETLSENFDNENEIRYIDISTVGFGELKKNPVKYKFSDAPSRARRIINYGDTIISTVRTYLKSMCFVDNGISDCIVSTGFAVLTPNEQVYPKLLNYVLSSNYFVSSVSKNSIGVSYPAISESKLISLKIALPKNIDEQRELLKYIHENTQAIDKRLYVAEKEIELINEYRIRLISDVVTGKVDVRNIEIHAFQNEEQENIIDEDILKLEEVPEGEEYEVKW